MSFGSVTLLGRRSDLFSFENHHKKRLALPWTSVTPSDPRLRDCFPCDLLDCGRGVQTGALAIIVQTPAIDLLVKSGQLWKRL